MGGRNTASGRKPPPTPMPPPMPIPPPKPKPQPKPKPKPAPTRLDLTKMSDTKLASFVDNAMYANLPAGFHDDITQRLIYSAKWNDKPEIVTSTQAEAAAKKRGAIVLYRTNSTSGLTTAKQYSDAFRTADVFSTGGGGGQAYGGGAYFSDQLSGSKTYGYGWRSKNPPNTIGAVLNKNAKVVNMDDLRGHMGRAWISAHPQAARKLGFSKDRYGNLKTKYNKGSYTALAMAMGYNVVRNRVGGGEHYYTVLDRSAVTTSTKDYFSSSRGMK